jgi:hypothetical protein
VTEALRDPAWFRAAIDTSRTGCSAPSDAGDNALADRLGSAPPAEAVIGSVWSGGRLVALVYGDVLPARTGCEDVKALDAVLREAGQALGRALVQRADSSARGGTD